MRVLRGWVHGLWRIVTIDVGAQPQAFVAPRFSPGNRHKRGFSENCGYCSGASWLVMGVGASVRGWVVRFGRAGRGDAHLCAVCTDLL